MKSVDNFVDILSRRAAEQADQDAYLMLSSRGRDATAITYEELDLRARTIAAQLQQTCVPGDRVLIIYHPGLEYICAFYGCLYAGMIAVPSYPPGRVGGSRASDRLQRIAVNADIACVLTGASMLDAIQGGFAAYSADRQLRFLATDDGQPSSVASEWKRPLLKPQDIAFLQYTSGSTGEPKGVMVSHGNLVGNSELIYRRFSHTSESRGVIWLPPYHDMGLIGGILQPLYGGFPTMLMSPLSFAQSPLLWLQAVSKFRATTSGGPDFAYAQCVRDIGDEEMQGLDLSGWKVAFTGAEPIRAETLAQFGRKFAACGFDAAAFYPCYGLAEATLFVSGSEAGSGTRQLNADASKLASQGIVQTDPDGGLALVASGSIRQQAHRVVVVDPETRSPVPENQVGEVWVQGPSVAHGYWNNPLATQHTFEARLADGAGPFMRTGDLGFLRGDELYVTGRIKDLIIVRGRNHHPHDIETTARRCDERFPQNGAVASFVGAGEALVILCEADKTIAAVADELLPRISLAVMEEHGLNVGEIVFVKPRSLPRTSSGKLRRHACEQLYRQADLSVVCAVGAGTPLDGAAIKTAETASNVVPLKPDSRLTMNDMQQWLLEAIARTLKQPIGSISADREFFQLGLNSLQLMRLSAALEEKIGQPVDPVWFFDFPSASRLAAHLASAGQTGTAASGRAKLPEIAPQGIAVVGLSCRLPGAPDKDAYWCLLDEGRDAISTVPEQRWSADPLPLAAEKPTSRWGGFIDEVDCFDAGLFGVSPKEAVQMDPQQRILMELAFDALQDAGLSPEALKGSRTGVFVGISSSDYSLLQGDPQTLGPYSGIGNAHSVAANRISYFFDFRGPSVAVDTACSSSLVALHLACQSLKTRDCDIALVGGINLMLTPHLHVVFSQAQMMAADGRCKAFDDSADGYVRGEGGGFVVLRRMPDACESNHRILAQIHGSAVNQDGRTNGLTAPSARAQEEVIQAALVNAGLAPHDIGYVEAHGTGTKLGDPIEFRALRNVYAQTPRPQPLLIGSAKSNIGHLESAAGIAGVIKAVLSLQKARLPQHLHFRTLNRQVLGESADIEVCASSREWRTGPKGRIAGVSSFGFGGTNCHVLIGEAPSQPRAHVARVLPPILTLSAASPNALKALCQRYGKRLESLASGLDELAELCHTTNLSRAGMDYRWAASATDGPSLRQRLDAFHEKSDAHVAKATPPRILFAFSGQGAQAKGMGRALDESFPVFRQALDACEEELRAHWPTVGLRQVLYGNGDRNYLAETEFAQPAIFSYQYALTKLWRSFGLEPAGVIGHSLGEYSAACVAGAIGLRDALALLVVRGRLMQAASDDGRMLVVFADEARVRELLDADVSIAAVNAAEVVVVAGRSARIQALQTECAALNILTRLMPVSQAFHSADLDPVLDEFERVASGYAYAAPRIPLYSNLTGEAMAPAALSGRYWRDHMRNTVRFSQGLEHASRDQMGVMLEIGADATLCALAGRRPASESLRGIPSSRAGKPELEALGEALAALYAAGAPVDWNRVHEGIPIRCQDLPGYPFDRTRFWLPKRESNPPAASAGSPSNTTGSKESMSTTHRSAAPVLEELRAMVSALLGIDAGSIDDNAPFLEMGADSLILISAIQAIDDRYGVHLSVNQLFGDTSTLRSLAAFIEANVVIESAGKQHWAALPNPVVEPSLAVLAVREPEQTYAVDEASGPLADLFKRQLGIMADQIALLQQQPARGAAAAVPPQAANPVDEAKPFSWGEVDGLGSPSHGLPAWARPPVLASDAGESRIKRYLDDLLARHTARTPTSKAMTKAYRPVLADNRASAGFRLSTKEGLYPIVGKAASGARMWDIDGNEYIDFTMGFGCNLFGHSPDFVIEAIREQIDQGFQLGPQSDLAGAVAEHIAAMTGQERVAFCNSGSEAIMTAVRLARAVTKRDRIAIFSGSYHGTFDGVLARSRITDGHLQTTPVAPGTPRSFVEREVLVLEYGSEDSLRLLAENADSLAAVIVEPVQSRSPENQPYEFLRALRTLTEEHSVALIWDEVITGFRAAPGGAQEYFGIKADLATYGKIIGGGMPIGVVAGRAKFLDAIDGGVWDYGDASYPKVEQTFFAGTFNKHPLTMRTALAVLEKLKASGPELQKRLNLGTAGLAKTLNRFFADEDIPIRIEHFSSLFRFSFSGNMDLLFLLLMHKGIYIWEGRNCFLSTAHSDTDIQALIEAVKSAVLELKEQGFFQSEKSAAPSPRVEKPVPRHSLNVSQQRFAQWAKLSGEAAVNHIPFAIRFHGKGIRPEALEAAINGVIARHETLRASFDLQAGEQRFAPQARLPMEQIDLSEHAAEQRKAALLDWQNNEVRRKFDLEEAPLLRACLLRLGEDEHVLHLTVHHLVCDGLSLALMLDEIGALYAQSGRVSLPKALSLAADIAAAGAPARDADEAYWMRQLASPPRLFQPVQRSSPASAGERLRTVLDEALLAAVKTYARRHKCTPFMVLFAAYASLLADKSGQDDLLIGVPSVERLPRNGEVLLGCFVRLLPVRCTINPEEEFAATLEHVKDRLLDAYRHAGGVVPETSWVPNATFNLEPPTALPGFGELKAEILECPVSNVEFDVMLNATEFSGRIYLDLDYRLQSLNANQAQAWLGHYRRILEQGVSEGATGNEPGQGEPSSSVQSKVEISLQK